MVQIYTSNVDTVIVALDMISWSQTNYETEQRQEERVTFFRRVLQDILKKDRSNNISAFSGPDWKVAWLQHGIKLSLQRKGNILCEVYNDSPVPHDCNQLTIALAGNWKDKNKVICKAALMELLSDRIDFDRKAEPQTVVEKWLKVKASAKILSVLYAV